MDRWAAWDMYDDPLEEVYEAMRERLRELRRRGSDSDSDDGDPYFDEFIYGLNFVVQEPEDLRREPSALESELRRASLSPDYAVAKPWFRVISASLQPFKMGGDQPHDSHAVRVGREETDWWITTTTFVHPLPKDQPQSDDAQRTLMTDARLLREALYVTSLLAEMDHSAWLGELLRTNDVDFSVPMAIDLTKCELPRQYEMAIYDGDGANQIHALFTDNAPLTVEFRRAVAKLCAVAKTQKQLNLHQRHYCVPIRLVIHGSQSTSSACAVRMLNKVVAIVRGTEDPSVCGLIGPSLLRLEGIEISMGNVAMDVRLLAAIETLLSTGARIHALILPRFPPPDALSDQDPDEALFLETETRLAWGSFVRTLLLIGTKQVDTVHVGVKNMRDDFVAPFFSALAHACAVRRLVLSQLCQQRSPKLFVWLAFALFSRASTSSIRSLSLLDVNWRDGVAVDYIGAFMRAQDPVSVLWRLVDTRLDPARSTSRASEIFLEKGTVMTVLDVTQGSVATLRLLWDASGTIVEDDEVNETITILTSGIGFCQVKRPSLGPKRRRVDASPTLRRQPSIKTLVINAVETVPTRGHYVHRAIEGLRQSRHQLSRLLRLVGPSLTGLSLTAKAMDDSTVEAIAQHCKQLQSLCLSGGTLRSMAPLVEMFRASASGGLSSLDLHGLTVPIDMFEAFLVSQRTATPRSSMLRRLRFGGDGMGNMYRRQTGEAMRAVLQDNKLLTHVQIYVPQPMPSAHFGRRLFHGETLPVDSLPVASRIALLSIPTPCFAALDRPLLAEIFAFAASPSTWRRMIVCR